MRLLIWLKKGVTKQSVSLLGSFLVLVLLLSLPVHEIQAQGVLELSTTYPGITAAAGENITFPLRITNNGSASEVVNLKVSSVPENWSATLRGRGKVIQQVFVKAHSYETADLKLQIPDNAKAGDYSVTVAAVSERGYRDNLKLSIKIAEARTGDDELIAQYSELKGPSDATYNFKLDLTNNGSREQIYSLGAKVPEGWQVTFKPSYESQQVASISVKAGETQGLDVKVTPPASVESGEYTIPVQAVSSDGRVSEELKVIISGSYDMEFTTPSGRLNADVVVGKEKKVNLKVENTGSAVLNNISFSSREPQNWSVTFEPKKIDTLKPGESRQITAIITSDAKAISGDYLVSLSASTRETRSSVNLRVTVKTPTLWGIVGLIIVLLVVAGVYWTFRTYGRR